MIEGVLKSDASVIGTKAVLFLSPWSDGTSAAGNAPLRIQVDLARTDPKSLLKGTRVRVVCDAVSAPARGELWWTAIGSAVEIAEAAAKQAEVAIVDPVLGLMKLDRKSNEFEGKRTEHGKTFELSIARSSGVDDRTADERDMARGRAFVTALDAALPGILRGIADRLLPLYNGTWRGDREELDEAGFVGRLSISSARAGDGETDGLSNLIYFADGDLFGGHLVEVFLDDDLRPTFIELAG